MIIMTDLSEVLIKGVYGTEKIVAERYGEAVAERYVKRRNAINDIFCELLRGHFSENIYWDVFLQEGEWPFDRDELKEILSINMIDDIPGTLSVYQRIIGYPDHIGYDPKKIDGSPRFWLVSDHIAGRVVEIEYMHPDIFDLTTNQIWSFICTQIKSDPNFFPELISTYNLAHDEIVFIDDLQINIDAATSTGITGILFQNPEQLEKDLTELGFVFAEPFKINR